MATRIFCFVIVVVFLASVVGFSVYLIYQYAKEENETPKTSEELNADRRAGLENLGDLEDFEPLGEGESILEPEIQELKAGEEGLEVLQGDIITIRYKYALAQDGQIIFASGERLTESSETDTDDNEEEADEAVEVDDTETRALETFCSGWPESLLSMRINGKRRLLVPASQVGICNIKLKAWPTDRDLIIDVELVGLADRSLENFEPLKTPLTELITEDLEEGTGRAVQATDRVKVNYVGVTAVDGYVFNARRDVVLDDDVIEGQREGVVGMKVGGKRRLYIPAAKAYGEQSPSPRIPPNSDLVFDIELISIE